MDVCGSHCESPNVFYLHLVKNKEILEKVMTNLSEVYCDLRPTDNAVANPVVGMFCAAKFPGEMNSRNTWLQLHESFLFVVSIIV